MRGRGGDVGHLPSSMLPGFSSTTQTQIDKANHPQFRQIGAPEKSSSPGQHLGLSKANELTNITPVRCTTVHYTTNVLYMRTFAEASAIMTLTKYSRTCTDGDCTGRFGAFDAGFHTPKTLVCATSSKTESN
jgi:hypothetical protein